LNASAAVLLAVVMGAAATKEPVSGAFGLAFDEPVTDAVLAASLGAPPYPLPPRNLDQTLPEPLPGEPNGWFLFIPEATPEFLDAPGVRFMVLRNRTGYPVRIVAEHPSPTCADDMLWLTRSLERKYGGGEDPFGAERDGFRQSARYLSEKGQVDLSCGPRLLIEYTDTAGYEKWLAAEAVRRQAFETAQSRLAKEHTRLELERQRRVANLFTAGDRYRLDGALGVTFGEPMDPAWLESQEIVVDVPLDAQIPGLPEAISDGRFTVTLGPDMMPVRVTGEFADPDATRFDQLAAALQAKYGTPLKDTPIHQIHKISGDYLIARYVHEQSVARLVFIDDKARRAQQAREAAAKQARLAEQQRQFDEETEGL
jgi:hypothetical protein